MYKIFVKNKIVSAILCILVMTFLVVLWYVCNKNYIDGNLNFFTSQKEVSTLLRSTTPLHHAEINADNAPIIIRENSTNENFSTIIDVIRKDIESLDRAAGTSYLENTQLISGKLYMIQYLGLIHSEETISYLKNLYSKEGAMELIDIWRCGDFQNFSDVRLSILTRIRGFALMGLALQSTDDTDKFVIRNYEEILKNYIEAENEQIEDSKNPQYFLDQEVSMMSFYAFASIARAYVEIRNNQTYDDFLAKLIMDNQLREFSDVFEKFQFAPGDPNWRSALVKSAQ